MNCPICNKEILNDAKFCRFCGSSVHTPSYKSTPLCPRCNKELSENARFCRFCGTPVFTLEHQKAEDDYRDSRKGVELDFQNRKMNDKMEMLRQAQAIREQREEAEHQRNMEKQSLAYQTELEHHRITASMSFEQIMASNPNISPAAAEALAKKFETEAAVAQRDRTSEIYRQHDENLMAILAQQMSLTRDIINHNNQANGANVSRVQVGTKPPTEEICFCPACGQKNPAYTAVCRVCGKEIEQ